MPGSKHRAAVRETEDDGTVQMLRPEHGAMDKIIYVAGLGAQGGCPRERGCCDRADAKAGAWCDITADTNICVAWLGAKGGCPRERGCGNRADDKTWAWCGG